MENLSLRMQLCKHFNRDRKRETRENYCYRKQELDISGQLLTPEAIITTLE